MIQGPVVSGPMLLSVSGSSELSSEAYSLLHWSYPRDMRRLQAKQEKAAQEKNEQAGTGLRALALLSERIQNGHHGRSILFSKGKDPIVSKSNVLLIGTPVFVKSLVHGHKLSTYLKI